MQSLDTGLDRYLRGSDFGRRTSDSSVNSVDTDMTEQSTAMDPHMSSAVFDAPMTADGALRSLESDEESVAFDMEQFRQDCWTDLKTQQLEGHGSEKFDNSEDDESNRIVVAVRTRPINEREDGVHVCVEHFDPQTVVLRKNKYARDQLSNTAFAFDYAFSPKSGQDEVFVKLGWRALRNAFSGYNVSIFAYGQTGSGKSHSMIGTEKDPGMTRRVGEFIFDFMARGSVELGASYMAKVSAVEIYNENVRDLILPLVPGMMPSSPKSSKKRKQARSSLRPFRAGRRSSVGGSSSLYKSSDDVQGIIDMQEAAKGPSLKIRENATEGVYVEGLSKVDIRSIHEMNGIIFAAIENRVVRATNMNEQSSRSHLIFTLYFTQVKKEGKSRSKVTVNSKINLIDLAGSERARTTGMSGDGLREGANINKSLSTLGRVISILASGLDTAHVPYRDSKLTHILKDSLGGNSKTSMLATISPSELNFEESWSTRRDASSVKRIKTAAAQNLDWENPAVIEKLKAEIDDLKARLMVAEEEAERARQRSGLPVAVPEDSYDYTETINDLRKERDNYEELSIKYREQRDRLQDKYETRVEEISHLKKELGNLQKVMAEQGMDMDGLRNELQTRRGNATHLGKLSSELQSSITEKERLEAKLRRKSQKMKDPLAMMGTVFSSALFGADDEDTSDEEGEDEEDEEDEPEDNSYSMRQDSKDPDDESVFLNPGGWLQLTAPQKTRRASTDNTAESAVINMLRTELEESNEINQKLEDKVHEQQIKIEQITHSMTELRAVQAQLDKKVWEADKAQLRDAQERLSNTQGENRELRSLTEAHELTIASLNHTVSSLREEVIGFTDEKSKLAEEHQKAVAALQAELILKHNLETENTKLKNELTELQMRHAEVLKASKSLLAEEINNRRNKGGGAGGGGGGGGPGPRAKTPLSPTTPRGKMSRQRNPRPSAGGSGGGDNSETSPSNGDSTTFSAAAILSARANAKEETLKDPPRQKSANSSRATTPRSASRGGSRPVSRGTSRPVSPRAPPPNRSPRSRRIDQVQSSSSTSLESPEVEKASKSPTPTNKPPASVRAGNNGRKLSPTSRPPSNNSIKKPRDSSPGQQNGRGSASSRSSAEANERESDLRRGSEFGTERYSTATSLDDDDNDTAARPGTADGKNGAKAKDSTTEL